MTIADEMDIPLDKVKVTLADARPELVWNQLTGGSNSMHSIFTPVRVAAALAKGQLLQAAAAELGGDAGELTISGGVIKAPNGQTVSVGSLASKGAVSKTTKAVATLKPQSQYKLVGTPQRRIDALEAVTGRKQFAMDIDVPGALPTMVCRPPTINGTALRVNNQAQVQVDAGSHRRRDHPAHGVRSRGRRGSGAERSVSASTRSARSTSRGAADTVDGKSDADVVKELKAAELPLTPAIPIAKTLDQRFTFYFRPGDPLETNCAIADVKPGSAEVWSSLKSPIWAQEEIAKNLGLSPTAVTVPRHPGRGIVRPASVRGRGVRGRRDLAEARQAGEADVAPHRQLPPGAHASDVHLARARQLFGRERARLRPAAHERRDRLHPRAR